MRTEIEERFRTDLSESKKTENDLFTKSNLRNNFERQRVLFNSVVDQLKQAQLVSDYGSVNAQVLNPPVPTEKWPSVVFALFAALLLGIGLGSGVAFVAGLLDARVRLLSEIREILNLRVLGVLPQLTSEQLGDEIAPGLIGHLTPRSLWAESCKSIRTSLDLVPRSLDARVLLVTSPQSGDGKSTAASNMAICLAHAGPRVLLIDADLRRPNQHLIHGVRQSPGFTHVLKDVLPYHRVVQRTPVDNLDILAAGPEVANPAELLASPRLASLVEELRTRCDVIVFDSSPLLAVTDASILATVVDGITLIVRVSATRRHELERTVELTTHGTPVLGTVVNGLVREQFGNGYGCGYGYGCGAPRTAGNDGRSDSGPQAQLTGRSMESAALGSNGTGDHATSA
jgi:capsular exopolysaccharide synthesis family protein